MKTVVVTGATDGIGFAVCEVFIQNCYRVIGVGRCAERCAAAQKSLLERYPQADIVFFYGDMMQQRSVRRVASEITGYLDGHGAGKLDALVNNAGCMRSWYATTEEGYEQQFALNYLSGFLLTHLLLPYLQKAQGCILFTSSGSHKMMNMHWKDIMYERRYRPLRAYKQSKLANMLLAFALKTRYAKMGIHVYGVDPGLVRTDIGNKDTGGLVNWVWTLRKGKGVAPSVTAQTYRMLCEQQPAPQGLYYKFCRQERYSRQVNAQNADKLFALSEKLCGINFGG